MLSKAVRRQELRTLWRKLAEVWMRVSSIRMILFKRKFLMWLVLYRSCLESFACIYSKLEIKWIFLNVIFAFSKIFSIVKL